MNEDNTEPKPDSEATQGRTASTCSAHPNFCIRGYSTLYLPDLEPETGIRSFMGLGRLEIRGKLLICHEGQVWDIRLTNGNHYSCQEGLGGTFYDSSGSMEHGSGSHAKYLPNVKLTGSETPTKTQ